MNQKIVVLGIGTLGSFVVESISNLENVKEVIIYDPDIVESKNLVNSIYRENDIGNLKTDALKEIVTRNNKNIIITRNSTKFIEGKVNLPRNNLVLDCRDYTFDRLNQIDARLYISSRYLIIDCKRNISYKNHYEGRYLTKVDKTDLKTAGFIMSMLIYSNAIKDMIKKQQVNKFDLDYLKKGQPKTEDVIYDSNNYEDKLLNLPQTLVPIMDINRKSDIDVYVGSKNLPIIQNTIPQNTLTNGNDIVNSLMSLIQKPFPFNHYVIHVCQDSGEFYIELLPETGAA